MTDAVISPMLITFLGMDPYQAIGIALASDVLASAVSAYEYGKNKNLDIKNGLVMMFTVMTTKEKMMAVDKKTRTIQSILCGAVIGLICGFVGAGGGMMMLLILTSVLGYELKTAVGTSVFIMTFTAFTGAASHFYLGGMPDVKILLLCALSTLFFARVAAVFANKASAKTLNRALGVVLTALGVVILGVKFL